MQFAKMHGLGNDFVVINALDSDFNLAAFPIASLGDRHTGIGFDQLLVIEPRMNAAHSSGLRDGDFFCRIFNSDGSEARQCGNGLRCVARYIHEEGLNSKRQFKIATVAGAFDVDIQDYDHIRVTMGAPDIKEQLMALQIGQEKLSVSILDLGNPHAVLKVSRIENVDPEHLAPQISNHAHFTDGANVGFMEVVSPGNIRLCTFERGAGLTNACGSNACAAAVAGMINGWLSSVVEVEYRYGKLLIEWEGVGHPVYMTGPAALVFRGAV